jgi:signal peptidase I
MSPRKRRSVLFLPLVGLLLWGAVRLRQHYFLTLVVGQSMNPTIASGELLLVDRLAYRKRPPARDDIVVASHGTDLVVKRIVGLPGEEVEVRHGVVYVNGMAQRENHPIQPGLLDVGKGKLFDDDFATLGDNRAVPTATAIHPIVSPAEILGKVVRTFFKVP